MRNIFAIYNGKDRKNDIIDGETFISKRITSEQKEKLDASLSGMNEKNSKANLPGWLQIVRFITGIFTGIVAASLMRATSGDLTLAKAFGNAPVLIIAGMVSGVIFLALFAAGKVIKKKVTESSEYRNTFDELAKNAEETKHSLGVPDNARDIDVLLFRYKKEKNGSPVPLTNPLGFKFFNADMYAYIRDDCLCFADSYTELAFPLGSIKVINRINKNASMQSWNKPVMFNSEKYKKYKIRTSNNGVFYVKPYYSILISDARGEYEIYIPSYDLEEILMLKNFKVNE